MEDLLTYIIRANLLLGLIYLGYQFLLKNLTFYTLNRVYFILGALYALVFPIVDFKKWLIVDSVISVPLLWDYIPVRVVEDITKSFSLYDLLLVGIGIGFTVFVLKLIIQLVSLLRIHFNSNEVKWQTYLFRNVIFPVVPFSFFNKIYIHQAQHKEMELNDILEHETVHVKGQHTWDVLLFEMLLIGCWYNPFVWLMRKAVRQNLEFLTDQQVLNKGVDRQTYQYSLLHVTQRGAAVGISNQFNFKTLKKRIMMMNKKRSSRLELSKYAFLLPIVILAGASFTISKAESKIEEIVAVTKDTALDIMLPNSGAISQDLLTDKQSKDDELVNLESNELHIAANDSIKNGVNLTNGYKGVFIGLNKRTKAPLYILNGKEISNDHAEEIDPSAILSISIWAAKDGIERYGDKGKNGVVFITLKKDSDIQSVTMKVNGAQAKGVTLVGYKGKAETMAVQSPKAVTLEAVFIPETKRPIEKIVIGRNSNSPLYIVDDVDKGDDFDFKELNVHDIESINVLKDSAATAVYGDKANKGVIIITTKKYQIDKSIKKAVAKEIEIERLR